MSQEQLQALRDAAVDNAKLHSELEAAATAEEFVAVAEGYGFSIALADLPMLDGPEEVSDAELEGAAGGYTFPPTDWIYCANPWTNVYCTLKC
ncbi:MAG: Nif11-like leader peptide family RiPP precursor [Candidatus Nanopelagicales bacterium]